MDHILVLSYIRHILDLRLYQTSTEKLDYKGFASHFANKVWKLSSVYYCCKMEYVLQSLQNNVPKIRDVVIDGSSTKKLSRRRVSHTKLKVCDEKETLWGYSSGVHMHEKKMINVKTESLWFGEII